jgi:hypothetical protein
MAISPTYDSEYWLTQFFSFRNGLFWSFLLSFNNWGFMLWFLFWWIMCAMTGEYCLSEIPGITALSYYFWIFLALWLGYTFNRYREIWEAIGTTLGRISDLQTQSVAWLRGSDAHDICRWACAYLLSYMLECSNIKPNLEVPYNFLRGRKLLNDQEYLSMKSMVRNKAGSPSFLLISWLQKRMSMLQHQGWISNQQFSIMSQEIVELRRNGGAVGAKMDVMIPWPIHQMANFIATSYLLMIGLQYSQESLGIISFIWQLFAIQTTRLMAGRLAHPLRLNMGWDWLHQAPSSSLHAFPLVFGKIYGLGNYLTHASTDLYLYESFSPYDPETLGDTAFNSQTKQQELKLGLERHNQKCLRIYGSSHLVDWCRCSGSATDSMHEVPFGKLGKMARCTYKALKRCFRRAKKTEYSKFPDLPPEPLSIVSHTLNLYPQRHFLGYV